MGRLQKPGGKPMGRRRAKEVVLRTADPAFVATGDLADRQSGMAVVRGTECARNLPFGGSLCVWQEEL